MFLSDACFFHKIFKFFYFYLFLKFPLKFLKTFRDGRVSMDHYIHIQSSLVFVRGMIVVLLVRYVMEQAMTCMLIKVNKAQFPVLSLLIMSLIELCSSVDCRFSSKQIRHYVSRSVFRGSQGQPLLQGPNPRALPETAF